MAKVRKQIGWAILEQEHIGRQTCEFAAWYTDIKLPPGRYPVIGLFEFGRADQIVFGIEGTIVEEENGTYFGGVRYGDGPDRRGQTARYIHQMYGFIAARMFFDDDLYGGEPWFRLELLPGFKAVREPITRLDGTPGWLHSIIDLSVRQPELV